MPAWTNGFCFLNDPAFVFVTLLDAGQSRVFYLDLDSHRSVGMEAAVAADARVMTVSLHERDRLPFNGKLSGRASGKA